jgi:hypothetical protein
MKTDQADIEESDIIVAELTDQQKLKDYLSHVSKNLDDISKAQSRFSLLMVVSIFSYGLLKVGASKGLTLIGLSFEDPHLASAFISLIYSFATLRVLQLVTHANELSALSEKLYAKLFEKPVNHPMINVIMQYKPTSYLIRKFDGLSERIQIRYGIFLFINFLLLSITLAGIQIYMLWDLAANTHSNEWYLWIVFYFTMLLTFLLLMEFIKYGRYKMKASKKGNTNDISSENK